MNPVRLSTSFGSFTKVVQITGEGIPNQVKLARKVYQELLTPQGQFNSWGNKRMRKQSLLMISPKETFLLSTRCGCKHSLT